MTDTPIDTLRMLLESSLNKTDDSEVKFKLRTALQLLTVIEEQRERVSERLDNAPLESEVRDNLQELGYLD